MFQWFASSLASKFRLTDNKFQLVGSKLSWRRNYDSKFVSPCTKYKTVMAEAMCNEGCKVLASGVNTKDLREGVRMAFRVVLEKLSCSARVISTSEEIALVATNYANGDKEIGLLVAKAMEEVRNVDGCIFTSVGKKLRPKLRFFYGIKLDEGYLSSCFVTNKEKKICVLNNPKVFICEDKLSNLDVLGEVLRLAAQHPILILAKDFDDCVVNTLISRKLITGNKVCAVRAYCCYFGLSWSDSVKHIACSTGGKVFTEDSMKFRYPATVGISSQLKSMFGHCHRVIIGESDTIMLARHLSFEEVKDLRSTELECRFDEDYMEGDEDHWLYAVLKVGGACRADVAKKKNIVTHALKAAKAATKEGIVPGGGTAFLNASKELDKLQITNSGQKIGVKIIQDALKMPVFSIASSGGVEGSVVVGKLLEQDNPNLGYDASKGELVDMVEHGIVDPLKVTRSSFVGATRMFLKKLRKGELISHEGKRDKGKHEYEDEEDHELGTLQGKAI